MNQFDFHSFVSRQKSEATRRMKTFLLENERCLRFCGCLGDGELLNPDGCDDIVMLVMVDGRVVKHDSWNKGMFIHKFTTICCLGMLKGYE